MVQVDGKELSFEQYLKLKIDDFSRHCEKLHRYSDIREMNFEIVAIIKKDEDHE